MLQRIHKAGIPYDRAEDDQVNQSPDAGGSYGFQLAVVVQENAEQQQGQSAEEELQRGVLQHITAAGGFVLGIDTACRPDHAGGKGHQHAAEVLGSAQVGKVIAENKHYTQAAQEKPGEDEPVRPAPVESGGVIDQHHKHRDQRENQRCQSAGDVALAPPYYAVTQSQHEYAGNGLLQHIRTPYLQVARQSQPQQEDSARHHLPDGREQERRKGFHTDTKSKIRGSPQEADDSQGYIGPQAFGFRHRWRLDTATN